MSHPALRTLDFTVGSETYCLHPDAKLPDILDQISARQGQLTSMLAMTVGGAGEALRSLPSETVGHFMWACQSLAAEVNTLVQHVVRIVEEEDHSDGDSPQG